MAILFNCLGALLLISIGVLQFTNIWQRPRGPFAVGVVAIFAGLCLITSAVFQWADHRKGKREQAERDRNLPIIVEAAIEKQINAQKIVSPPVVEEKTTSVETLSPHQQLRAAQEAVFIDDVLKMSLDDVKLNFGHDLEFRQKFEAVPVGESPYFDSLRTRLLGSPLIAAKFVRAHLFPRSPWAEMIKSIFQAAGRKSYETVSDFLFDIHAVNVTPAVTTLQGIVAEAEIEGKWIQLQCLDDLSDYEKVFDARGTEKKAGKPLTWSDERTEQLPSFLEQVKNARFERGVGYQGWLRFELNSTSTDLEKPVNHKVRLVDAMGGIHPVLRIGPNEDNGEIRHSPKALD